MGGARIYSTIVEPTAEGERALDQGDALEQLLGKATGPPQNCDVALESLHMSFQDVMIVFQSANELRAWRGTVWRTVVMPLRSVRAGVMIMMVMIVVTA